jgi:hypothetical protein
MLIHCLSVQVLGPGLRCHACVQEGQVCCFLLLVTDAEVVAFKKKGESMCLSGELLLIFVL